MKQGFSNLVMCVTLLSILGMNIGSSRGLASTSSPNRVSWFDISVGDLDKAETFYSALFGWQFQPGNMNNVRYGIVTVDGKLVGELTEDKSRVSKSGPTGISIYFPVDDIMSRYQKALSLGASSVFAPMNIPGTVVQGSIAMVGDADGNSIGLQSSETLPLLH
jgi:predicted enzyme related to lactoylglutathione lyase